MLRLEQAESTNESQATRPFPPASHFGFCRQSIGKRPAVEAGEQVSYCFDTVSSLHPGQRVQVGADVAIRKQSRKYVPRPKQVAGDLAEADLVGDVEEQLFVGFNDCVRRIPEFLAMSP